MNIRLSFSFWILTLVLSFLAFASHEDHDRQQCVNRNHSECNREHEHIQEQNRMGFEQRQNLYEYNLYDRNQDEIEQEEREVRDCPR